MQCGTIEQLSIGSFLAIVKSRVMASGPVLGERLNFDPASEGREEVCRSDMGMMIARVSIICQLLYQLNYMLYQLNYSTFDTFTALRFST